MMDDIRMERNRRAYLRITEILTTMSYLRQIDLTYRNRVCGGIRHGEGQFDMP
jgi:hypothetical protein